MKGTDICKAIISYVTTFLSNHTARLCGVLNKKSVCGGKKKRGRERAFQVKNKKRWNADFWWRAFGSRQLLHYAPRRHKHAATVSVTKVFWWGRLASRLKSKYLSFLKRKHSWFVSRLNSTTAFSCMILTQMWPLTRTEGGKERVYSTSVTHSTSEDVKLTAMQHRDDS